MGRSRERIWIGVLALGLASLVPVPVAAARPAIGDTQVFARISYPGEPGGITVSKGAVYVNTFGFPFTGIGGPDTTVRRPLDPNDYLFAFDLASGAPVRARSNPLPIPRTRSVAVMGLSGMTHDRAGILYMVDMNARIVRVDPSSGHQSVYATFPLDLGGPVTTMPLDLVFDQKGYAYVTDIAGLPVIWRVPPGGGAAEPWFVDPRLAGYYTEGGGGIRIDPSGQDLLFTVVGSLYPSTALHGLVLRLPLGNPSPAQLENIHQYESPAEAPPLGAGPLAIAIGTSGRLYVALPGTSQISVLRPNRLPGSSLANGYDEERRLAIKGVPNFLAFDGKGSLLVTTLGDDSPDSWIIYKVFVNDTEAGAPLPARRRGPSARHRMAS